jgi:spermidine synthase
MATDKFDLGYMEHIYEPMFEKEGNRFKAILELGVFDGESIKEWHTRFPGTVIHGIDSGLVDLHGVNPDLVTVYSRVDAYKPESITRFMGIRPQGYDLIIEDGPHTLESQLFFVRNYGALLSEDGIMVVEDIIHSGAREALEQAIDKKEFEFVTHDMRGKQLSNRLRDRWQSGIDVIVLKKRKKVAPVLTAPVNQTLKSMLTKSGDKGDA